jgi:hypothetical protein
MRWLALASVLACACGSDAAPEDPPSAAEARDEAPSAPEPVAEPAAREATAPPPPEPAPFECPDQTAPQLALGGRDGLVILDGTAYAFEIPNAADSTAEPILEGVRSVARDHTIACAVTDAGRVRCWGELDTRPRATRWQTPTELEGFENVVEVSVAEQHVCARDREGRVRCLGDPPLGRGTSRFDFPLPAPAVDIASGGHTTCAAVRDGSVWCWGALGMRGFTQDGGPAKVRGIDGPLCSAAVSELAACFLAADHSAAYCMGDIGTWYYADVDEEDEERGPVSRTELPVMPSERVELSASPVALSVAADHACLRTSEGGLACIGGAFRNGRTEGFRARAAGRELRRGVGEIASGGSHEGRDGGRGATCAMRGRELRCFWSGELFSNTTPGETVLRVCGGPLSCGEESAPSETAPADCTFRVRDPSGTPLNVRAEPNGRAALVGTLENGTAVTVEETRGRWRRIGAPAGWVWADNLACE